MTIAVLRMARSSYVRKRRSPIDRVRLLPCSKRYRRKIHVSLNTLKQESRVSARLV